MVGHVIICIGIVDCSDVPRVESSSEAPNHLRIPICFLPSLAEIIIGPDVLIHLLKELLQGLWGALDHGLNDNLIRNCWRLCPQTQESSDIRLKVFLVILRALEQSLSSNRLRLKPLETGD